jgi:hypothetical protein
MIVLFAWHRGSVKAVLRAPIKGLFQPGEGCCTAGHAIADFRVFSAFSAICRQVSELFWA